MAKRPVSELVTNLPERMASDPKSVLFDLARVYTRILGIDFDREILPDLNNFGFWDPNYVDKNIERWGLDTGDAVRCLVDVHRTKQLFHGSAEVVAALKSEVGGDLTAIDAGVGTGILAISLVGLGVKKVTGIEIVPKTLETTREFIDELGLSDEIGLVLADATAVDTESLVGKKADVLISENLSAGLLNEPQYQIIRHLSPALARHARVIPSGAELLVSVGSADWEKAPKAKDGGRRKSISSRRLADLVVLSDRVLVAKIDSRPGMDVPRVNGHAEVNLTGDEVVNTLLITTRFEINSDGRRIYLEPDTAEFLGKTLAIEVPEKAMANNGKMDIELDYPTGANVNLGTPESKKGSIRFKI